MHSPIGQPLTRGDLESIVATSDKRRFYFLGAWILPSRRRVRPYSIQNLERLKPAWFKEDLAALFELLKQGKIKPLVAQRFPLAEARKAQELLGKGGVTGKFVLVCNEQPLVS